jgi:hypothetical protein
MNNTKISWDELTERGRIASANLDKGRWEIGDLACEVAKVYGTDQMEAFAREIGQKKETVKGYKRVARAFPKTVRVQLFDEYPNLFYSHYRTAVRLESPSDQIHFLEQASSNNWTTDEADREMGLLLGKPDPKESDDDTDTITETSATIAEATAWVNPTGDYLYLEDQPEVWDTLRKFFKNDPRNAKVKVIIVKVTD